MYAQHTVRVRIRKRNQVSIKASIVMILALQFKVIKGTKENGTVCACTWKTSVWKMVNRPRYGLQIVPTANAGHVLPQ